jgi:hypothetical protein
MQLPRIDAHLSPSHFLTFSLSHFLLHHSDTSDGRRPSLVGGRKKKRHSPPRHRGHKGRNAKKEVAWRWIGSSVVRVVRGHKGKILTTEITENTEEKQAN